MQLTTEQLLDQAYGFALKANTRSTITQEVEAQLAVAYATMALARELQANRNGQR